MNPKASPKRSKISRLRKHFESINQQLVQIASELNEMENSSNHGECPTYTILLTKGMVAQALVAVTNLVEDGKMELNTPFTLRFPQLADKEVTTKAVTSTIRIQERATFNRLFQVCKATEHHCLHLRQISSKIWEASIGEVTQSQKKLHRRRPKNHDRK